jgi:hypothetical protein
MKGKKTMTTNEAELIQLIRSSSNPEILAQFMFGLFSDYLRTRDPSQEKPSAAPPVCVGTAQ